MPEILAVGWHVWHGGTTRLKQRDGTTYAIKVPTFWYAQLDDNSWDLSLIRLRGRIRSSLIQPDWAMMTFSVAPAQLTSEQVKKAAAALNTKAGVTTTTVANVSAAGQGLECFEQKWSRGDVAALTRDFPVVDLLCTLPADKRGFSATFTGSPTLVPQFYEVLNTMSEDRQ
jgi:hypothetical protein